MIRSHAPVLLLFVSMFFMLLVAVPACGPNKRAQSIQTTLIAVNAARDGFVAWDRQHQSNIVDTAAARQATRDEVVRELDAYHIKRAKVTASFEIAYRALAIAATQSDEASLRAALAKAGELRDALLGLGVK